MKLNFNGKQTLVIAGSAIGMGAVIFAGDVLYHKIRNRKAKEEPVEETTEDKAEEFVK